AAIRERTAWAKAANASDGFSPPAASKNPGGCAGVFSDLKFRQADLRRRRQPNSPIAPRPLAKSGSAAGNGVSAGAPTRSLIETSSSAGPKAGIGLLVPFEVTVLANDSVTLDEPARKENVSCVQPMSLRLCPVMSKV